MVPAHASSKKAERLAESSSRADSRMGRTRCHSPGSCPPLFLTHLVQQPGSGRTPTSLHRGCGDAHEFRGIFYRKAAEIAHLDDLALLRIKFAKPVESSLDNPMLHLYM